MVVRAFRNAREQGAEGLSGEGKTVLVADDDPVIREYLTGRCKEIGLRVETAADGDCILGTPIRLAAPLTICRYKDIFILARRERRC